MRIDCKPNAAFALAAALFEFGNAIAPSPADLFFCNKPESPTGSLNLFAKDIPSGSPLSKDKSEDAGRTLTFSTASVIRIAALIIFFSSSLLQQAYVHFTSQTEHRNH
jgi:hypothetical protein